MSNMLCCVSVHVSCPPCECPTEGEFRRDKTGGRWGEVGRREERDWRPQWKRGADQYIQVTTCESCLLRASMRSGQLLLEGSREGGGCSGFANCRLVGQLRAAAAAENCRCCTRAGSSSGQGLSQFLRGLMRKPRAAPLNRKMNRNVK